MYFPLGDLVISEEDITLENVFCFLFKKKKKGNHKAEEEFTTLPEEEIPDFWTQSIYVLNSLPEMTQLINFCKALQVSHSKFWCFQVPKEVSNLNEFKIFTCI